MAWGLTPMSTRLRVLDMASSAQPLGCSSITFSTNDPGNPLRMDSEIAGRVRYLSHVHCFSGTCSW